MSVKSQHIVVGTSDFEAITFYPSIGSIYEASKHGNRDFNPSPPVCNAYALANLLCTVHTYALVYAKDPVRSVIDIVFHSYILLYARNVYFLSDY